MVRGRKIEHDDEYHRKQREVMREYRLKKMLRAKGWNSKKLKFAEDLSILPVFTYEVI